MKKIIIAIIIGISLVCTSCNIDSKLKNEEVKYVNLENIPDYHGEPYIILNSNCTTFTDSEMTNDSFETYSNLDYLGRCGVAQASIGEDLMPTKKRGSIGSVKPTAWHTVKYDNVDGKYLYNRCHLIGYQLTAENANEKNLITGTRYLNIEGMLPFENMVADYVKETGNHVLYKVTPVYENENLVASGVIMEGYSVEDKGEGICFNVYAYNVQPGIDIDYLNGESHMKSDLDYQEKKENDKENLEIRGNSKSKIYHCNGQAAYDEMKESKNLVIFTNEKEAIESGYRKAKR